MSNTTDRMVVCRKCGSEHCYEKMVDGVYLEWDCLLCGFTANTHLLANTLETANFLKGLPLLYQQLAYIDSEGFTWVPQYKRVNGVGEVYANTINKGESWFWTASKHVPVLPSEKEMYKNPDGTYREYKADAANAKHFHNEAFAGALIYLGIL